MSPKSQEGRWMLFVDGENLTIRAKAIMSDCERPLKVGPHYIPDVFVWLPLEDTGRVFSGLPQHLMRSYAVRAFYYTSVFGDDVKVRFARETIRNHGFSPEVFKRTNKDVKAKGVDIALTKDMLSNAHLDNYDLAVLVAGDGDYIPLVEEVKRLGKVVVLAMFEGTGSGLNPELRLSCDMFVSLNKVFRTNWIAYYQSSRFQKDLEEEKRIREAAAIQDSGDL